MTKVFLLFSLVAIMVIGCKKNDNSVADLNPDFTVGLSGNYPLTFYREGSQSINLPSKDVSGQFDISRIDITHIKARLTITSGGTTDEFSTNDFELKRDAGNANLYTMFIDGQIAGTITKSEINVSAKSPDGTVTEIKAKR